MAKERKKRLIIINPDEPRAGEHGVDFYRKVKPVGGTPEIVNHFRKELRGLRGQKVTATFRGLRVDAESGITRRFRVKRTFVMNTYADMFGPGGAYHSAMKATIENNSDDELAFTGIEVEEVDYGEDSEEYS